MGNETLLTDKKKAKEPLVLPVILIPPKTSLTLPVKENFLVAFEKHVINSGDNP